MSRRKRAPGAGAKPKGPFKGKSATLTTRITPETRGELEHSAQERGRSLSQEVEFRLRDFARQNQGPPHIRSLAQAAALLVAAIERRTGKRCVDDAFTAEAVRQATSAFLLRRLPISEGPPRIPPQLQAYASKVPSLREALVNPVALGELECEALIYAIENAPLRDHETPGLSFPAPEGLSSIRDHLGFGASKEKQR
jgi:hypothetical protein